MSDNLPASIKFNNPGAINGNAAWVRALPGFLQTETIGGGNPIAVFDTAEHGLACYYKLLQKYRDAGAKTVQQIVNRYGGGQDYSAYVSFVCNQSGLPPSTEIKLTGDDATLLVFCKAMFRYEAGRATPWTDAQIISAFDTVRGGKVSTPVAVTVGWGGVLAIILYVSSAHWKVVVAALAFTVIAGAIAYHWRKS